MTSGHDCVERPPELQKTFRTGVTNILQEVVEVVQVVGSVFISWEYISITMP
jgi:hypothetical protein